MCEYGDVYMAKLPRSENSKVQYGLRPVVVVSNNMANFYSPVITVIPLTSRSTKKNLPTHVFINGYGLRTNSIALVEQITTIDKSYLTVKICSLAKTSKMAEINRAIAVQLSLFAA